MTDAFLSAAIIGIVALMTWLTRGLPYLVFRGKQLPNWVSYLGAVLPASIMAILMVYCLRGVRLGSYPYGLAEFLSVGVVVFVQLWRRNTFLSILAGTVCYMVLIRTVFSV